MNRHPILSDHAQALLDAMSHEAPKADQHHMATAVAFGVEAFLYPHPLASDESRMAAFAKAFLTAAVDPLAPELDYLRQDASGADAARAERDAEASA